MLDQKELDEMERQECEEIRLCDEFERDHPGAIPAGQRETGMETKSDLFRVNQESPLAEGLVRWGVVF